MSRFSVLVYHRAVGYVHPSIADTVRAVERLGSEHGFAVETTDDPDRFTARLAAHDVTVFAHTTGNVLPEVGQRRALESFVRKGGGFLGIHAASSMAPDVRDEWPWFVDLVGTRFKGHTVARIYCDEPFESPGVVYGGPIELAPETAEWINDDMAVTTWEEACLDDEAPDCPAAHGLRARTTWADEWYGFDENPRPWVSVVATVDETTYEPHLGEMGADHPVIWWREFDGGRSVYNSMGHAASMWQDEAFLQSILGCIELAAGAA